MSAGLEEKVETRRGDNPAADEQDRPALKTESEEQGSALLDFGIRFGRKRGERRFLWQLCSLDRWFKEWFRFFRGHVYRFTPVKAQLHKRI